MINNFVVDHVLRGMMINTTTNDVMWSVNQITEPSLSITADEVQAVDAMEVPIATFNRAKQAEFSANNSLFDLGLFAAQNGRDVESASANSTILMPAFEEIAVPSTVSDSVSLDHTPSATPQYIYKLNGDGTLGSKLTYSATAGTGKFTYANGAITFPSDATAGDKYFVQYNYNATSGTGVTGTATDFPRAGKFVMEVLGTDVCDPSSLVHAYIVFPNAKLDSNVEVSFATDSNHPFVLKAQQAYCDSEKKLFSILIPEED